MGSADSNRPEAHGLGSTSPAACSNRLPPSTDNTPHSDGGKKAHPPSLIITPTPQLNVPLTPPLLSLLILPSGHNEDRTLSMEIDIDSRASGTPMGTVPPKGDSTRYVPLQDVDDFLLDIPGISIAAWHLIDGFVTDLPTELTVICKVLRDKGCTPDIISTVCGGQYVFWSWRSNWIIMAALVSTFANHNDHSLILGALDEQVSPLLEWVDPPSRIEPSLGCFLLARTKVNFPRLTKTPIPSPHRTLAGATRDEDWSTEIIYSIGTVIMKMTVTLPQFPPSCQQHLERINHLRRHTKLLLSMKESHHEVLSKQKPDIIFDAPVDGFHATLHRTVDNHLLLSDLESLSSSSDTVIGIRITSSNFLPRFSIPSSTFSNLVTSLERRFFDLASNHSLWGSELNAVTKLERPLVLTDKEFLANYVLIGNIDPSSLSNQISTVSLQNMIRKVVSHSLPGCKVDEEFFSATFNEKVRHLRPNNLGIEESKAVRTLM